MTHSSKFRIATKLAVVMAVLPASAMAGTRAGDTRVVPAASKSASASQGPKGGFPNSPGLVIAKLKANGNAAFKSNGT